MKRIDIDEDTEKMIALMLDLLYKRAGFEAHAVVSQFLSKVYEVKEE